MHTTVWLLWFYFIYLFSELCVAGFGLCFVKGCFPLLVCAVLRKLCWFPRVF